MVHYRVKGIYVGRVEMLVCPLGHYYVLTEEGYETARKRAEELGLLAEEPAKEQVQELGEEKEPAYNEWSPTEEHVSGGQDQQTIIISS
ncbi:hypothetical protein NAS2_1072 [Conexivisphaera calida]|uniref:Uncharacterized protein n=2 Tax=Conexivisphaera calida TaxID=1874277 RepID=A0A4P2VEC1_9ARCH|nr:hypothetical protein NAS2_1072 [Conexivisphaera calida]